MPYADSDGARIHYEVAGAGPPLLLHPGALGRLQEWQRWGYVAALQADYRVLLLDPRGWGASDSPHDPAAYTLARRVGDVLAVLDAAGVAQAHLWGYSLGGYIALGCGVLAPQRCHTLIIGGAQPFHWAPEILLAEAAALRQGSMADYVAGWETRHGPLPPETRTQWLALDAAALAAHCLASSTAPDLSDALPHLRLPALVYAGEEDPMSAAARRAAARMPAAAFVGLPACGHSDAFHRSDVIVPHVRAFLARAAAR